MSIKNVTIKDLSTLSEQHAHFVIEYCKDLDARRAAVAVGIDADFGFKWRDDPFINEAICAVLRLQTAENDVDANWMLKEAKDLYILAKQQKKLTTAAQCLNIIGKHAGVDAFAAEKVQLSDDKDVMKRLMRSQHRIEQITKRKEDRTDFSAFGITDPVNPAQVLADADKEAEKDEITFL